MYCLKLVAKIIPNGNKPSKTFFTIHELVTTWIEDNWFVLSIIFLDLPSNIVCEFSFIFFIYDKI